KGRPAHVCAGWGSMQTQSGKSEGVLLVGAGRMGGALLKGWLAGQRFSEIHVIEPKPSPAIEKLAGEKAFRLHRGLERSVPVFAAAVLAMKPQILKGEQDLLAAL